MKMPLGIIVNENQNPNSADTWALVLNDMVINTIIATGNQVVGSWLISSYDYIVDLTIQGQNAGVGWTYSPGGNTFTTPPPPPINWQDIVQEDFDGIMSCLYQIIQDAGSNGGSLTTQQITAAYNAALEDQGGAITPNEPALLNSLLNFVQSGG